MPPSASSPSPLSSGPLTRRHYNAQRRGVCDDTVTTRHRLKRANGYAWKPNAESKRRQRFLHERQLSESLDPSPERRGRLECSHGNRASLSPFWGAGGVASGNTGLHAVWTLQAQGVVCLAAARWRLMMQDGVMDCGRQICACEGKQRQLSKTNSALYWWCQVIATSIIRSILTRSHQPLRADTWRHWSSSMIQNKWP